MRLSPDHRDQIAQLKLDGFRVITVATSWRDTQVLMAETGSANEISAVRHQAMTTLQLIARVELGQRTGVPFFDQPTVLVVGGAAPVPSPDLQARWQTVLDAAQRSPNPVHVIDTLAAPAAQPSAPRKLGR